ncbi:MAG: hypothetical protein COB20_09010 [SAR86 cluster bacterium]|uniref:Pilus formation protein N-terminal domain-containing protein n=1 Tax=SAR86 cluster bacterium TaxID=2030880 RepID=A0A2A4X308_9GAMM|nr:MAG: hypothetical protein COB20_09010 [SAR86 cluster bacterium]
MHKQIQSLLKRASLTLIGCVAIVAHAQDSGDHSPVFVGANNTQSLTLFDDVETAESRGRPVGRTTREGRATTAEPEFTLVGVSRLGDKYSAILRAKDGESFIVKADPSVITLIPEHSDYAIVDVTTASVSIRYPSNNACIEFSDRGVSCSNAANIAELVLANGEPLAARNPARELAAEASTATGEEIIEGQAVPGNPFEALRNGRRGDTLNVGTDATSTSGARFTPRRIDPEDVPEGKRIVATPFGDRLVDQ